MSKAIRRLQRQIRQFKAAKQERRQDARELRKDLKALKKDRRQVERHRDVFEDVRKDLKKDRKRLGNLRERAEAKLSPLEEQAASLQTQYDATVDPLTGLGDPALKLQLDAVNQRLAAVHARFDPKIAERRQEIDALGRKRDRVHDAILGDRKDIKQDRREVKRDRRALKHSRKDAKEERKEAREHLRPAVYEMNLKRTNRVRRALGLKPVDHVIRPGVPNVVGGQVGRWIAKAQTILKRHGVPLSKMNARDIALIIRHESGGNPKAVNNWDSNAAAGTPSKGLMQTIGPTFNAYKLPGHGRILNPVDNIIAAVRYAIARYGSISNVPGVRSVHSGGSYVGY